MAMVILSVLGLVTFSLFILEEAFQTAMFGTWPAQDAGDWAQVYRGTKVMAACIRTMKIINYAIGWIQPLAFISYRQFALSGDYYIKSLQSKVLQNSPMLMLGQKITLIAVPKSINKAPNGRFWVAFGKIRVYSTPDQKAALNKPLTASGILKIDEATGTLFIDRRTP